jgi:hypothetical protein
MGGSLLSLVEIFYHLTLKRIFEKPEQPSAVTNEDPKT